MPSSCRHPLPSLRRQHQHPHPLPSHLLQHFNAVPFHNAALRAMSLPFHSKIWHLEHRLNNNLISSVLLPQAPSLNSALLTRVSPLPPLSHPTHPPQFPLSLHHYLSHHLLTPPHPILFQQRLYRPLTLLSQPPSHPLQMLHKKRQSPPLSNYLDPSLMCLVILLPLPNLQPHPPALYPHLLPLTKPSPHLFHPSPPLHQAGPHLLSLSL